MSCAFEVLHFYHRLEPVIDNEVPEELDSDDSIRLPVDVGQGHREGVVAGKG
jgi:hypothetical protein